MAESLDLTRAPGWEEVGRLIGSKIREIDGLRAENASLRSKLKESKAGENTGCSQATSRSESEQMRLKCLHEESEARYAALESRHKVLQRKYDGLVEGWNRKKNHYHEAKKRIREWQEYLRSRNFITSTGDLKNELEFDRTPVPNLPTAHVDAEQFMDDAEPTPRQPTDWTKAEIHADARTADLPIQALDELPSRPIDELPSSKTLPNDDPAAAPADTPSRRVSSSQTTDEPIASSPTPKTREPYDEPTVVSARPVNRRRSNSALAMPPPVRIKQEDTSDGAPAPIDLISEDVSSPKRKRQRLSRTQTSDLDALVEHIKTPRKHGLQKQKNRMKLSAKRDHAETTSRPHSAGSYSTNNSSSAEASIKEEHSLEARSGRGGVLERLASTSQPLPHSIPRSKSSGRKSEPLASRSPNIPTLSNTRKSESDLKRKRISQELAGKIRLVSEGGNEDSSQADTRTEHQRLRKPNDPRLSELLNSPVTNSEALTKRATPITSSTKPRRSARKAVKEETTSSPTPNRNSTEDEVPSPGRPEDEPLRSRPLKSLRLDDFRINPRYMNANFAFADTIRGKAQRKCLPGCTRPECCGGTFLAAVAKFGAGIPSSEKSDEKLLEDFLGSNWAEIMGAYGPEKRKDLLNQARAFAFANLHGKHRAAFERHSTPPGFWRTDMPTTQEEMEDRERAREMERGKVEERWREAMRESGRWKFRDE